MNLVIPDDILTASEMTEAELKLEIAITLYKREKISTGKACEWLGLNLVEFRRELGNGDSLLTTMLKTFKLTSKPCTPLVGYDDCQQYITD